jgi:hypothetical protein
MGSSWAGLGRAGAWLARCPREFRPSCTSTSEEIWYLNWSSFYQSLEVGLKKLVRRAGLPGLPRPRATIRSTLPVCTSPLAKLVLVAA